MVGRRNRGIFLSRHECTGLLKKGESSIQQWSGFGHKFIPPDPGKEAIFQKQLRRYSTTTRANHLRLDIGDINEELPINQGERRHAGAMRVGRNVSNRTQGAAGNGEKDTIEGERAVEVTESEEGPDLKIIHSQPDQISQPISISRGDKWTGKNKKRELDVINRDVGQSTRKKSRVAAGNNGVNDNEGEGKGIDLVQNHVGASSQGGGGWPSTATTSP
ncbi:hypothetical protein ACFX11_024886 [Malus domestica]